MNNNDIRLFILYFNFNLFYFILLNCWNGSHMRILLWIRVCFSWSWDHRNGIPIIFKLSVSVTFSIHSNWFYWIDSNFWWIVGLLYWFFRSDWLSGNPKPCLLSLLKYEICFFFLNWLNIIHFGLWRHWFLRQEVRVNDLMCVWNQVVESALSSFALVHGVITFVLLWSESKRIKDPHFFWISKF